MTRLRCACGSYDIELKEITPCEEYPDEVIMDYVCESCGAVTHLYRPRKANGKKKNKTPSAPKK